MQPMPVQVSAALLQNPDLKPSVKVLWMARSLSGATNTTVLEARSRLSPKTVRKGLGRLPRRDPGGARVTVPPALLAERKVGALGKVLYGLLQLLPTYQESSGLFTYAALAALAGVTPKPAREAISDLARRGWLNVQQANRKAPILFTLLNPGQSDVDAAQCRLNRAEFRGEQIMKELLTLLIHSEDFEDNATPGFLVNPSTGERLELDRHYPSHRAAFEFQGPQHFSPNGRFSAAEVALQQTRDYVKLAICVTRGIHLVAVRPEDLSLRNMQKLIPENLPRRDLTGHETLAACLEEAGRRYRLASRRAREKEQKATPPE